MNVRERVLEQRPLVHCITNYVTMDWVARGLLAAGARPVMVLDESESPTMAGRADALLLNLGTWSPDQQRSMLAAGRAAQSAGVPVVLDPVGAGALPKRTEAALEILNSVQVSLVRGNAGEIAGLAGNMGLTRGVDSALEPGKNVLVEEAAKRVARRFRCMVVATGKVDLVTDGRQTWVVRGGHAWMGDVPGAGCLGGALLAAAFASLRKSGLEPTAHTVAQACLWIKAAGEQAALSSLGPGSFTERYLDALATCPARPERRITTPLSERLALCVLVNGGTPLTTVESLLAAGVPAIQFREKSMPIAEQVPIAKQLLAVCHDAGALFVVNDRVDLALAVEADGVHLGQEDLPVTAARRLLGPDAIIGVSCASADEAQAAATADANYIGAGAVYSTPSKADAGEAQGCAVIERVRQGVSLPVVGIGGITAGRAAPVVQAGAVGVAVISAVLAAPDPAEAAARLLQEVREVRAAMQRD